MNLNSISNSCYLSGYSLFILFQCIIFNTLCKSSIFLFTTIIYVKTIIHFIVSGFVLKYEYISLPTAVEGYPKALFSIANTPRCVK